MKPSGRDFLTEHDPGALDPAPRNKRGSHEAGGRTLHPHGPLVAPPTYFFLLYTYVPPNHQRRSKTPFPPPEPYVPVRSHLGTFSGDPPEGALITEGFYINTIASPMMCE